MIQIWPIRDLIWPPMSAKYVKINQIPSIFRKLNWNYPFKFQHKFLKPYSVVARTLFPLWDSLDSIIISRSKQFLLLYPDITDLFLLLWTKCKLLCCYLFAFQLLIVIHSRDKEITWDNTVIHWVVLCSHETNDGLLTFSTILTILCL